MTLVQEHEPQQPPTGAGPTGFEADPVYLALAEAGGHLADFSVLGVHDGRLVFKSLQHQSGHADGVVSPHEGEPGVPADVAPVAVV